MSSLARGKVMVGEEVWIQGSRRLAIAHLASRGGMAYLHAFVVVGRVDGMEKRTDGKA